MKKLRWMIIALFVSIAVHIQGAGAQDTSSSRQGAILLTSTDLNGIDQARDQILLSELLVRLEEHFDVTFLYKDEVMTRKYVQRDNIMIGEKTGQELARILEELGITFQRIDEQTYVLLNKNLSMQAAQMQEEIRGTVTDGQSGETLPGVNVMVKGTSTGTSTDSDGTYELTVESLQDTLVFSFVGYQTQEVPIQERTQINVSLQPQAITGEEMVVVGYGEQREVNLTGSVSNISSEDMESRSVTKTSLALQGKMSGISARQLSGNPNNNSASLTIRGRGTFSAAGTSPLVLVDGIESSIDNVDPNDVESVSILKDAASAAIYGSKAANGVILIQTKEGVEGGEPQFSYNAYVGKQTPTSVPQMVNSWEYAEIVNEAQINMGGSPRYTEDEIQMFRTGTDTVNYPNFDHIDYLFGSGSGVQTKHNISMRGGGSRAQYMVSTSYYNQQGLIKGNKADRYNIRANLNAQIKDNLNLGLRLSGVRSNGNEPNGDGGGIAGIVQGAMRLSNAIPGFTPDGYYGRNETLHPEADLNSDSFLENTSSYFYVNANLDWNILDNLTLSGRVGYTYNNSEQKDFIATYDVTPSYGINLSSLNESWVKSDDLTLQSTIEYNESLNNHNITLLGGIEAKGSNYENLSAYRDDFPNNQVVEINAGATARGTQGGTASTNTLASVFGRANYNYQDKYLFEVNFRYDGSSRFAEGNRWGLFPSASVGWRITEENFFPEAASSWLSELKVRASWGQMGNQLIGNYPYQNLINLGQNYPFGENLSAGAAITTIANQEITWETTEVTDVGLDMALFENRLNFTVDYYEKETQDILYNISVSQLLGASPSETNAGIVENKGWDFDVSYNNTIGDFSYGASAILSIVHNKVVEIANTDRDIARGLFIGHPIGSQYGYVSNGLYADEEDVMNSPETPFSFMENPGGIKLADIGGPNGEPDGQVTAEYDRTVIGNPRPTSTYSFTLNGGYKNFDFNVLLQGEGGRKDMVNMPFFFPLANDGNVQRYIYENRWNPENPDLNAEYPRIMRRSTGFYRQNQVDFWFKDATFIRLKNAQIGYTLPEGLLDKLSLNNVRLYVTGENLFTLTNYYPGWDPEMQTTGSFYPLTRQFVLGIDIDF